MKKLQDKVRNIKGDKRSAHIIIKEEDIDHNMPYLKAVLNESICLHPPAPLLGPKERDLGPLLPLPCCTLCCAPILGPSQMYFLGFFGLLNSTQMSEILTYYGQKMDLFSIFFMIFQIFFRKKCFK